MLQNNMTSIFTKYMHVQKIVFFAFFLCISVMPFVVFAQTLTAEKRVPEEVFLFGAIVAPQNIAVPTVLELHVPYAYVRNGTSHHAIATPLYGGDTLGAQYYAGKQDVSIAYVDVLQATSGFEGDPFSLFDQLQSTGVRFPAERPSSNTYNAVSELPKQQANVSFLYETRAKTEGVKVLYAPHTFPPVSTTVYVLREDGSRDMVVRKEHPRTVEPMVFREDTMLFPAQDSIGIELEYVYTQPLHIEEISVFHSETMQKDHFIRFLAQPQTVYYVRFHPDSFSGHSALTGVSFVDLRADEGVMQVSGEDVTFEKNSTYRQGDEDADGVVNEDDSCPYIPNTDQLDLNNNGVGDACEDFDRDGVVGAVDNCPETPNADQSDVDRDGIGDVCDDIENRLTEAHPWLPFASVGIATVVLLLLGVLAVRDARKKTGSSEVLHSDGTLEK